MIWIRSGIILHDLQKSAGGGKLVNKIMDRVDQLEDFAESGMLLSSISE